MHSGEDDIAHVPLECQVCLEERPSCSALSCRCDCCEECLRQHLTLRIGDGDLRAGCPVCAEPLTLEAVEGIVPASVYAVFSARLEEERQNQVVSQDPLLCWCPRPDCDTVVRRESEACRTARCATCQFRFCFDCHGPAHGAKSCEQARLERAKATGKTDEIEFLKWAKRMTKRCPNPKCLAPIERARGEEGDCNHMICSKCHTEFCWLCGKKVPPIGHFDETNILGCPGLQYSGPDVNMAVRLAHRGRALRLATSTGLKNTARVGGFGILCLAAFPFLVAAGIPYGAYRGVKRFRRSRSARTR